MDRSSLNRISWIGSILRLSADFWQSKRVIALTAEAMSGDRECYLAHRKNGSISKPIYDLALARELDPGHDL